VLCEDAARSVLLARQLGGLRRIEQDDIDALHDDIKAKKERLRRLEEQRRRLSEGPQ